MLEILKDFHKKDVSREDLESELQMWSRIVENYEADDVYVGDQYYQDALGNRDALQEAIESIDDESSCETKDSREDLESELETWNRIVENYEANDVYVGDQYYQDALGNRDALKKAIASIDDDELER